MSGNVFLLRGKCNCYLVRGTRKNLLIDSGLPWEKDLLEGQLNGLGLSKDDIHLHHGTYIDLGGCVLQVLHTPGHGKKSDAPAEDFEKAIKGSINLLNDTRSLFHAFDSREEFADVSMAVSAYAKRV